MAFEVSKLLNLDDSKEVYEFLADTNNKRHHIWLRDSITNNNKDSICLDRSVRSLDNNRVINENNSVRPAYVLDLSKVTYTIG